MNLKRKSVVVARVYLTEASDLLDDILDYLKNEADLRGYSVFRAIRGMGDSGEHASRLVDISLNLPVIVEFFDEKEKMEVIIHHLNEQVKPGRILFWEAYVNA